MCVRSCVSAHSALLGALASALRLAHVNDSVFVPVPVPWPCPLALSPVPCPCPWPCPRAAPWHRPCPCLSPWLPASRPPACPPLRQPPHRCNAFIAFWTCVSPSVRPLQLRRLCAAFEVWPSPDCVEVVLHLFFTDLNAWHAWRRRSRVCCQESPARTPRCARAFRKCVYGQQL